MNEVGKGCQTKKSLASLIDSRKILASVMCKLAILLPVSLFLVSFFDTSGCSEVSYILVKKKTFFVV